MWTLLGAHYEDLEGTGKVEEKPKSRSLVHARGHLQVRFKSVVVIFDLIASIEYRILVIVTLKQIAMQTVTDGYVVGAVNGHLMWNHGPRFYTRPGKSLIHEL